MGYCKRPPLTILAAWRGRTRNEIAEHFGVTRECAGKWMAFYGLEFRAEMHPTAHVTAEMLRDMARLPAVEIAERLGVTENTVYHLYQRLGVQKVRPERKTQRRPGAPRCPCIHVAACREAEAWGGQAPCERLIDADDRLRASCAGKF